MTRPLKIAQVTGELDLSGGATRVIAGFAKGVSDHGVQVTVFAGYKREKPDFPVDPSVSRVEWVVSRLWGPPVLGLALRSLWRLFRTGDQFDAIHLNGFWNLTTCIAAAIARFKGVPYFISARGMLTAFHCMRYPRLKKIQYYLLDQHAIRHARAIHCTSDFEIESSRPMLGGAPVVKIPDSVDLDDFVPMMPRHEARRQLHLAGEDFIVLYYGRLARAKDPVGLLHIFEQANLPDNAGLYFVGSAEPDVQEALDRAMEASSIKHRIHSVGYVEGRNRHLWLAAADVYVNRSYSDNFCLVAVEAYVSGVACILSRQVGVAEFLDGAVDELGMDPLEWIDRLRELYRDKPFQRKPDGQLAQKFSPLVIGAMWLDEYRKMVL